MEESKYYDLKTKAVDDLVSAGEGKAPEYSKEELEKYKSHRGKLKIPGAVKVIFIKFWFPAAVCFFFVWGLGISTGSMIDTVVILGIVLGMVTDILTNNAIRYFETYEGEYSRWMMFPKKRYVSFVFNILYGFVIMFLVVTIYNGINYAYIALSGNADRLILGVEPIMFGVFCVLTDLLLIGMKDLFRRIISDAAGRK